MYSFPLRMVLVWVRCWLCGVGVFICVVPFSCVVLFFFCLLHCVRFPSFTAGSGYPLEGGRVLALLHFSASSRFFVVGVPSVDFDAQCSSGPANSL